MSPLAQEQNFQGRVVLRQPNRGGQANRRRTSDERVNNYAATNPLPSPLLAVLPRRGLPAAVPAQAQNPSNRIYRRTEILRVTDAAHALIGRYVQTPHGWRWRVTMVPSLLRAITRTTATRVVRGSNLGSR